MSPDFVKQLIDNAERLGGFSSAAVWAFFCLIFLLYIFLDLRSKNKVSTQAWAARLEEAKADMLMANSLDKLANEVHQLSDKVHVDNPGGPHV